MEKDFGFLDAIKELASGRPEFVSTVQFSERIQTCKECPYFAQMTKQCTQCGCFMYFKGKFVHSSCPQNRWKS